MLSSVFLFFSFSGSEIMLILFVALILFGGDKFPEIARGLGKGIREFKDMSDGVKREIHSQINNYDAEPNRTSTTPAINETTHQAAETFPEHETRDINMPVHDTAMLPVADVAAAQAEQHVAPHEAVIEKPIPPKPDFTPPENTISHQSY